MRRGSRSGCRCVPRDDSTCCAAAGRDFADTASVQIRLSSVLVGSRGFLTENHAVCWCQPPDTGTRARCLGASVEIRRIEYPLLWFAAALRDEHSPMSPRFLTHSAAPSGHALSSGRPSAQGGWGQRIVPRPRGRGQPTAVMPRCKSTYDPHCGAPR